MGRAYSRPLIYEDTGDSNRLKLQKGLTTVYLQPITLYYPTGRIQLAETAVNSGVYKADDVADGVYILYIADVSKETTYGQFWIGDDNLSLYAKLAGGNTFTGDQLFSNGVAVTEELTVTLDIIGRELFVDASGSPYLTNTPTYNSSLIWLGYLESRLSNLPNNPFQESINKVRCMPGATVETGKVYTTPKAASAYFATPGINNQCLVEIVGTGSISQYINMDAGTMRDYVHFRGAGKHIKVICRDGSTNAKITNFENLTVIFGANDFTIDRVYANKRFDNCDLYFYKNMTFNNCTLIGCRLIFASTYKAYLAGTTIVEVCGFNNEYETDISAGGYIALDYGIDITTLPTDPSLPEIN